MTWYEEHGFEYNPLCIKPFEEFELFFDNKSLVRDIINVINQGHNLVIKGALGTGKTSILKKIIDEFGGARKIFYYNAFSASMPLDFELVLKRAGGFFSRNLGLKSKEVILFVDEAQHLNNDNLEDLKEYIGDYFKSVVIASSKADYEVPDELKDEFKQTINLENFTEQDAFNIIRDRLGAEEYEEILTNNEIKEIYSKSKTPREFLLNCEMKSKEKYEMLESEIEA